MLVYFISIFLLFSLGESAVIPNDLAERLTRLNTSISDENCAFYTELEKLLPCGNDGYVLHFAHHYCQVFLDHRNEFIERAWVDATRRCLQVKMYEFVTQQDSSPSCQQIKQVGFDSHPICYEKPDESRPNLSFCRSPLQDKLRVAWLASNGALFELLHGAAQLKFCL